MCGCKEGSGRGGTAAAVGGGEARSQSGRFDHMPACPQVSAPVARGTPRWKAWLTKPASSSSREGAGEGAAAAVEESVPAAAAGSAALPMTRCAGMRRAGDGGLRDTAWTYGGQQRRAMSGFFTAARGGSKRPRACARASDGGSDLAVCGWARISSDLWVIRSRQKPRSSAPQFLTGCGRNNSSRRRRASCKHRSRALRIQYVSTRSDRTRCTIYLRWRNVFHKNRSAH